jgi:cell division septation protein DedD
MMNYIEVQRMRKQAGLGWGWVNKVVGDDNIVSDVFGNNRRQRLDNYANQIRQQMNADLGSAAIKRQQQGAAEWDNAVAAAGQHLNSRLAQRPTRQIAAKSAPVKQPVKPVQQPVRKPVAATPVAPTPKAEPAPAPQYQAFNNKNLSAYNSEQINAINAAARNMGIKANKVNRVRFDNNGKLTGINGIGI